MATVLRTPAIRVPPQSLHLASIPARASRTACLSFRHSSIRHPCIASLRLPRRSPLRFVNFVPFAASGDTETTQAEEVREPQLEEPADGAVVGEDAAGDEETTGGEDTHDSAISLLLRSYKEALASDDDAKVAEIEAYLKSIEDEKASLQNKVVALSAELSTQKDRILRISADFDNFRKRTETERLSLVSNAQGEVVENLLPVMDNFERAKTQIKVETEGEEKINNSYQSIYKQFMEILSSLGVVPVETVGNPFDPLVSNRVGLKFSRVLHELFQTFQEVCSGFWKTWIRF
ncbi:uncharacterized protein LOC116195955 isoform X2 [Punica granatum]|uniref:Uncharacterized protein LOC116195955 isoform X2 n=1 Tax=Punica granatum TaxID=22663 RepID=A0A6P8CIM1_PUNGR|nr:uncharacterized protein LOC116195955 isoform X2 [Punica granatum]